MQMKDTYSNKQTEQFCRKILPRVSRTFDLAIRFLPKRLGQPVGLAYLLCRIADTYEDSAILNPLQRKDMLLKYASLLENNAGYDKSLIDELENAFTGRYTAGDSEFNCTDDLPSLKLVENISRVLTAVDMLPPDFKCHIFPRVQEMALGMANYTTMASGKQSDICFLKDEDDWNRYCYYVAGTVGHMLTDLFSDYAGFSDATRERLHPLGQSFGLGLQKVNVLKDAVIDTKRGICFLPQTFIDRYGVSFARLSDADFKGDIPGLITMVVNTCHRHFQDSLDYIRIIPHKHLGLRMFLIIPVMLAAGTLRLCADYPQRLLEKGDLKLARSDVWKLVRRSSYCRFSNRLLAYSFGKLYPT